MNCDSNLFKTNNQTDAVFTVCSLNYLDKATVMLNSITDDVSKIIIVVDKKADTVINIEGISVVFSEDLNIPRYNEATFKYNVIEMNTCIKPYVCGVLVKIFNKVIYLDPDILVFDTLSGIFKELESADFLITPHATSSPNDALRPSDKDYLKFGLYNLGFFAATVGALNSGLINWWHNKLMEECFYEPSEGYGVDQKFVDLIPIYFHGVRVLKNKVYNIAFWNLHERVIESKDESYFIDQDKIVFVHFSSYAGTSIVAKKQNRFKNHDRPDFLKLLEIYQDKLNSVSPEVVRVCRENKNYTYDFLDNGMYITPLARRAYFHLLRDNPQFSDEPFTNERLIKILQSRRLLIKGFSSMPHFNFNQVDEGDWRVSIISSSFRCLKILLGPIRYFALCRYLNHVSSTLNQSKIL